MALYFSQTYYLNHLILKVKYPLAFFYSPIPQLQQPVCEVWKRGRAAILHIASVHHAVGWILWRDALESADSNQVRTRSDSVICRDHAAV